MMGIRQVGRRGMVWMGLVFGSIVVAATIAASSPPGRSDPGTGELSFDPASVPPTRAEEIQIPARNQLSFDPKSVPPGPLSFDSQAGRDLVVHEWGTFLGMNASDGTVLDGMYHEEHALPSFVHTRGRDQLRLTAMNLKGETPVIYFYTPRPVGLRVAVDFPQGLWTQWYPQAAIVKPSVMEQAQSPDRLNKGRICWYADVIPAALMPAGAGKSPESISRPGTTALPETRSDALWNYARDVDADFVRAVDRTGKTDRTEYERFLFYRGLGQSRMPMRVDVRRGGTLALDGDRTIGDGVHHIFILKVEGGRGAFQYRPALRPGEEATGVIPSMEQSRPLADFTEVVADALAAKLTESGLYPKEARAMVNTWKNSYFQNDGTRVLFVLPRSWTDAFIPMKIAPKPREVVRVMVGRLELLSPERERSAETAVRDLAGGDPARRLEAFQYLRDQGRYVEPIVRRIARTTRDDAVRTACQRLLLTELVTDIRSAIHNPPDGKRLKEFNELLRAPDPLELRAQLARLLREIGQTEEARAEAGAVWREARNRLHNTDPHEIQGAVHEALGDDRRAAESYAHRLEWYVRALVPNANTEQFAWLRDWWVGRAYARCLMRAGQAEPAIAAIRHEIDGSPAVAVNDPTNRLNRVRLGLLLDAEGHRDRAEAEWSSLTARPEPQAAAVPVAGLPKP